MYQGIGGPFGGFETSFAALLHNGYPQATPSMSGLHQVSHQGNHLFSPTGLLNSAFSPKGYCGGINSFQVNTPSHIDRHRSGRRHPKDSSTKKFLSLGGYAQPFSRFSPSGTGMESPMVHHA
jgi:hypothetical protein